MFCLDLFNIITCITIIVSQCSSIKRFFKRVLIQKNVFRLHFELTISSKRIYKQLIHYNKHSNTFLVFCKVTFNRKSTEHVCSPAQYVKYRKNQNKVSAHRELTLFYPGGLARPWSALHGQFQSSFPNLRSTFK